MDTLDFEYLLPQANYIYNYILYIFKFLSLQLDVHITNFSAYKNSVKGTTGITGSIDLIVTLKTIDKIK